MKSFLMKVRCFWQDMIKPLVAACCGPIRLVTKMRMAAMSAGSFFCVGLFTAAILYQQNDRSIVLMWADGLFFGCMAVSIKLFIEYEGQLDDAWRKRAIGDMLFSSLCEPLRKRHPRPHRHAPIMGYDHSQLLLTVMERGELPYDWCGGRDAFQRGALAGFGYIALNKDWKWEVTRKGWEFFDEARPMPRDWSPEDQPQPVSTPSPA